MEFIDMMGRKVTIEKTPSKIVSLVPSQTELLYDLGLTYNIAGQTVFCIHPEKYFKDSNKVGGTKKVRFDIIDQIKPDLVIGNKEENTPEIVETLSKKYPVWLSDIKNLDDALKMIASLGEITDRKNDSLELIHKISSGFKELDLHEKLSCLYLIWKDPYMIAGQNTFINDMLQKAGFSNLCTKTSYPEITIDEMQELNPSVILLSSEPYPFKEKHISELKEILPHTRIVTVNGELFSWYGSRLLNSPLYFRQLALQIKESGTQHGNYN